MRLANGLRDIQVMERRELGWIPIALAAWFAIFAGYEILERFVLAGASSQITHTLHIVRGTVTSFVLAGLVAWYILRLRRRVIRTAEDLTRERARTEEVVRSMGAGLMVMDLERRVTWSNEIAREWFGDDLLGKTCEGLWENPAECAYGAIVRGERAGTCQRTRVADGRRRFYLLSCFPIRDPDGRVHQILMLIQDITPMKEMEIQLVQAGKMAAVGQLAAGIAHEINNPLAIVASSAEILSQSAKEEPQRRHLLKIQDGVYRCKDIIENLLAFSRREEIGPEEVDLHAILQETLLLVRGRAQTRGVTVREELAANPLRLARSYPRQVQQIALNLLLNAVDATPSGGRVTLATAPEEGGVRIVVSDTGCGIPPENRDRIFEPFFTTKPVGKGTGLGLYLCHQFVEALGGRIEVRSRPGEGTTFSVRLPSEAPDPSRALREAKS